MAKNSSPLNIMNALGAAAHQKMQPQPMPDDQEDPANSLKPKAKKSPASNKSKQVAAMKEHKKGNKNLGPSPDDVDAGQD